MPTPQRTRPRLEGNADEEYDASFIKEEHPGGLKEFGSRSTRVTKEVNQPPREWARGRRPRSSGTGFNRESRFDVVAGSEDIIIKVLEPGPGFYSFFQHWIGNRPYTCPGIDDCPACARGDKARPNDLFNVVVLGDKPELKVWFATPDPASALEAKATSKKGPLNNKGMYLSVSKTKPSNGVPEVNLEWVKDDELEDLYGVRPLTDAELQKFESEKFDHTIVREHTISELQEVARKFLDQE